MSDNLARKAAGAKTRQERQEVNDHLRREYPGLSDEDYRAMMDKWHFKVTSGGSIVSGVLTAIVAALTFGNAITIGDYVIGVVVMLVGGGFFIKFSWVRKYDSLHNIRNL